MLMLLTLSSRRTLMPTMLKNFAGVRKSSKRGVHSAAWPAGGIVLSIFIMVLMAIIVMMVMVVTKPKMMVILLSSPNSG